MEDPFDFEWEERQPDTPFRTHMIAGSFAGIAEHVTLLPIDNLKTHIQTKSPNIKTAFNSIRQSGYQNFFRGSGIIALGCIPSHAFFFMNYEIFKKLIPDQEKFDVFGNMLLGGISTIFHDLLMTPCELVKQRAQLVGGVRSIDIIKKTWRNEGLIAFWRSFPVNFFSNLPNAMVTVSANENLKKLYLQRMGKIDMWGYFMCAGTAGITSALVTTPLDNIKTRLNVQTFFHNKNLVFEENIKNGKKMGVGKKEGESHFFKRLKLKRLIRFNSMHQTNSCNKCNYTGPQSVFIKYPNALCAVKIILREEGMWGFYKGIGLRLTTQSMSTAISWTVYEYLKKQLTKAKF